MSWGRICNCEDERHPFDERSIRAEQAIINRCRRYAADQEAGGLCEGCEAEGHEEGDSDGR